ncbi:MAG TPA: L-lactate dehydrogenase [Chloroflexota bacterium]|jgi:L-lactate dehydrogenase|nr:L-lactate dehydrogenase [Chloroflexota bacterium]
MKLTMVGAGRVGSTTLFQLVLEGGIEEFVIVDVRTEVAEGEALDLRHGLAQSYRTRIVAGDYDATAGSDIVVITAGVPRKPGDTRLDLLRTNVELMRGILDNVARYSPNALLFVVSNPVDVLTYQALRQTGWPEERVFGLGTVLDTTRFRSLLAERLEVSPDSVIAYMLGEHGDSMVPLLSSASVAGIPLDQFPGYSPQMVQEVVEATRNGGAEVIKRKGGTFYSVAPSICAVLRAVRWDLKQVLPVTSLVDGPLGLHNMCLSLPCIVGQRGRERVLVPPMTDQEREALQRSHRVLREAADSVGLP